MGDTHFFLTALIPTGILRDMQVLDKILPIIQAYLQVDSMSYHCFSIHQIRFINGDFYEVGGHRTKDVNIELRDKRLAELIYE